METERLSSLFELLKTDENNSFLNFAIAQEYLKTGNKNEALTYFKKILKTDPEYTGTYYHLGKLYELLGKYDQAITTYQTGMKISLEQQEMHAHQELKNALSLITGESDG